MLVGDAGKLVEPAAGELAEPIEMRFQHSEIIRCQIKRQQIAQAAVDGVEILSGAVGREMIRAAIATFVGGGAPADGKRVHG